MQILADRVRQRRTICDERDCSLQRRYPEGGGVRPRLVGAAGNGARRPLRRDAVKIAKAVGYVSAGTVEFLVDQPAAATTSSK